ncbi:unnamed protein product [Protopolystoma xenopodis]|uniref:Anaphase-promoting complex subunit 10 n=1 Tax=Protopolystoma xenopodis TaxID=117903 RepID=A0A3S5A2R0_9PLAT|nr:unnamed protein product [Protopolystoma xenopodis]
MEMREPRGWTAIKLAWPNGQPVRLFMFQLAILANHQNGRDTHLRAIRLHSPITPRFPGTTGDDQDPFAALFGGNLLPTCPTARLFSTIR